MYVHDDQVEVQRDVSDENVDKSYMDDVSDFAQNLKYAHQLSSEYFYDIHPHGTTFLHVLYVK